MDSEGQRLTIPGKAPGQGFLPTFAYWILSKCCHDTPRRLKQYNHILIDTASFYGVLSYFHKNRHPFSIPGRVAILAFSP